MKLIAILACLLLSILPAGSVRCLADDDPADPRGTLVCTVTRGPVCPVERVDQPCPPQPLEGMRLKIVGRPGGKVFTVLTDKNGVGKVSLPAGAYRVEMQPKPGLGFTKDLPANITITPGATVNLHVNVDSGIR